MTIADSRGSRVSGTLLLADISGYTGFLQGVADAHAAMILDVDEPPQAYSLMSSLLDTIVTSVSPPFELDKFEGDAIFATAADADMAIRGPAVVDCLRACYGAFVERLTAARAEWTCTCNSCVRAADLGLKFVVHHGDYVVQRIAGREELLGPDVNVVHRLLKNHARDLVGPRPYALLTDAALVALDVPAEEMVAATETYEDLPPIPVHVLPLG